MRHVRLSVEGEDEHKYGEMAGAESKGGTSLGEAEEKPHDRLILSPFSMSTIPRRGRRLPCILRHAASDLQCIHRL